MTFSFAQPWLLLLLPLAFLPWWRALAPARRATVAFADTDLAVAAGRSWASRFAALVPILRSLAIALIVVSLARPVKADEQTRVLVEGVAIEMVVDRSSSMRAMDFSINGEPVDRLTALKSVVRDFVDGGDQLKGRPNDLIGAVAFAGYADSICPQTLDHDHLLTSLRQVAIAEQRQEDGTAIGDAMALAVERLKDVAPRTESGERIKSRVMILLTDGENNAGDIDPREAAELARTFGIKIYAIGMGTRGMAPFPVDDAFAGRVFRRVPVSIDEDLLRSVSESTGGKYFRATDTKSLAQIYEEIDRLEKTETEARRYLQYTDLAVEGVHFRGWSLPPLLAVVAIVLFADLALRSTRFRSLT